MLLMAHGALMTIITSRKNAESADHHLFVIYRHFK